MVRSWWEGGKVGKWESGRVKSFAPRGSESETGIPACSVGYVLALLIQAAMPVSHFG